MKALAFTAICALAGAPVARAGDVQVFLLGGQSNMAGVGANSDLTPPLNSPLPAVQIWTGSGWADLAPGFGNTAGHFGPELTFGHAMAANWPGVDIRLVKHAASATSLVSDWHPSGGPQYNIFNVKAQAALLNLTGAGHTPHVAGMLWTQGERDARVGPSAYSVYEANLTALVADVRTRYGADLPFVVSRLSAGQTNLPAAGLAAVRTAQTNVALADPLVGLVDTDAYGLRSDALHFDSAGQISLGQGFAAEYMNVIPEPAGLALLGLGAAAIPRKRRK